MSRLDDMERRLAALESGGNLTQRIEWLEDQLGCTVTRAPKPSDVEHCDRCGMDQKTDENFKCPQAKCPLNA